jgi:acyl-coenzyme A thioesterase PaaI-like protein
LGGFADVVHGGIIGALLDEALIWGAFAATGRFGVTAELTVRYLKPLRIGDACSIEGLLVEDKRRIWLAESRLFLDNGETLARAEGKIRPMPESGSASFERYLDRRP